MTAPVPRLAVTDTGEGRPVLFQHGLCGDQAQPGQVFPPGFRRLTVECRGHGGSDLGPVQDLSIARFTQDIAAVLDQRGLGPLPVGGISMGAAIALRLAVTRPDLTGALILARPAWVTDPAPPNMAPNAEVGALLAAHPPETARALFEAGATARGLAQTAPDNLASLRGFFDRPGGTAALLQRIAADGPGVSEGDLARLSLPCLVIGHGQDDIHPLSYAERLAALIPGARLVTIPPKASDPQGYREGFRAALAGFLGGL